MLTELSNIFEGFNSYIPVEVLMYWLNPFRIALYYYKIGNLKIELKIKEEEFKKPDK